VAFVAYSGTNNIVTYTVDPILGSLTLLNDRAVQLRVRVKAIDMVMDASGSYLYLLSQGDGTITGFTINANGSLTKITTVTGLPTVGTWGMAGY
jgi:6-phosphogluconolactonase (cycloisomerase 2 family)